MTIETDPILERMEKRISSIVEQIEQDVSKLQQVRLDGLRYQLQQIAKSIQILKAECEAYKTFCWQLSVKPRITLPEFPECFVVMD